MNLGFEGQELPNDQGLPLFTSVWECVAGLVNVVSGGAVAIVGSHHLNTLEFYLLRALLRMDEGTASELTDAFPVTKSRISRIVSKLVGRGLISRRRLRNDRRVVMLSLTAKGKAVALDIQERLNAFDAMLTENVSKQEKSFLASAAAKIAANCPGMTGAQSRQSRGM